MCSILKDEGASSKVEETSNSSNSCQTTHMTSFGRTYTIVEQSSEESTSNEGTLCVRRCEEEVSSSEIYEIRSRKDTSTSGRSIEESLMTSFSFLKWFRR